MQHLKNRDCLIIMFEQVRAQRPPISSCDKYQDWMWAIGDCISCLPTQEQRWAATAVIAEDIYNILPGMTKEVAYLCVLEAVMKAGARV